MGPTVLAAIAAMLVVWLLVSGSVRSILQTIYQVAIYCMPQTATGREGSTTDWSPEPFARRSDQ